MNQKASSRALVLFLLLTLTISVLTACARPAAAAAKPQTFTGIVTDQHCFLKKPDLTLDSKKCLQMEACAATGYGVAVLQSDKTYKFYYLDGEFAPSATDGQLKAIKLIDASTRVDHFYVTVTGTLTGQNRTAADGKSYPLIKVDTIVESNG